MIRKDCQIYNIHWCDKASLLRAFNIHNTHNTRRTAEKRYITDMSKQSKITHCFFAFASLCLISFPMLFFFLYRGADKSFARPDRKKKLLKGRHFSSDAEVIAAAETWLDGQLSEMFLSGLQKLEFGRCSLFPSW